MDPWKMAFLDLHRQAEELFEELIFRPWAIASHGTWRPPLDLHETADAYHVDVDLPGVAADEVTILVREQELTVTGRRTPNPPEGVLSQHCERPCGAFHRVLNLPQPVDPPQARAEFRQGTCHIVLPRKRREEGASEQGALRLEGSQYTVRVTIL